MNLNEVNKEGFALKQSSNVLMGFQKRFLSIKNERFSWFKSNFDSNPQKSFHFSEIDDCFSDKKKDELTIIANGKKYLFKFESINESQNWLRTINILLKKVDKKKKDISDNKNFLQPEGYPYEKHYSIDATTQNLQKKNSWANFLKEPDESKKFFGYREEREEKASNCRFLFCCIPSNK